LRTSYEVGCQQGGGGESKFSHKDVFLKVVGDLRSGRWRREGIFLYLD
jgi:hypothetical protein